MAATQFDHIIRLHRIIQKIAELGDEVASKILKGNKCKEEQTSLNLLVALFEILKGHKASSYKAVASFRLDKVSDDLVTNPQTVSIYAGITPVLVMTLPTALPSSDMNINVQFIANLINTTSTTFTAQGIETTLYIKTASAGEFYNGTSLNVVTDIIYIKPTNFRPFQYGESIPTTDVNCLTQTEVDNLFLFIEKKYCIDFGVYGQTTPETIEDPNVTPLPESARILQEDGFFLLQEDGAYLNLESNLIPSFY